MLYLNLHDTDGFNLTVMKARFYEALESIGQRERILLIPPDITRLHGLGGLLATWAVEYYKDAVKAILPALGTHVEMSPQEIDLMYPNVDHSLFVKHNWRDDIVTLGTVPPSFIKEVSEGKLDFGWDAQVNKLLVEGDFDLILSLGQVVPHEVVGMANYSKNIFVGTGGSEGINKSHFLGAVYGMERMMGRADSPVRSVLDYAQDHFAKDLPIVYALTVVGRNENDTMVPMALFVGDDRTCFEKACEVSQAVNVKLLAKPLEKVVVYLEKEEYRSTWLGNKAIYRTRMALADRGELIIIAPGVQTFGEDKEIDRLIRIYGYKGTDYVLKAVKENVELQNNLSAAAHLIHGSSEQRFEITYCPGHLSKEEIESVGYKWGDIKSAKEKYLKDGIKDGYNTTADGQSFYFIANPATGLWAYKEKFK
jgi:nickel-dependent lactate racemase